MRGSCQRCMITLRWPLTAFATSASQVLNRFLVNACVFVTPGLHSSLRWRLHVDCRLCLSSRLPLCYRAAFAPVASHPTHPCPCACHMLPSCLPCLIPLMPWLMSHPLPRVNCQRKRLRSFRGSATESIRGPSVKESARDTKCQPRHNMSTVTESHMLTATESTHGPFEGLSQSRRQTARQVDPVCAHACVRTCAWLFPHVCQKAEAEGLCLAWVRGATFSRASLCPSLSTLNLDPKCGSFAYVFALGSACFCSRLVFCSRLNTWSYLVLIHAPGADKAAGTGAVPVRWEGPEKEIEKAQQYVVEHGQLDPSFRSRLMDAFNVIPEALPKICPRKI